MQTEGTNSGSKLSSWMVTETYFALQCTSLRMCSTVLDFTVWAFSEVVRNDNILIILCMNGAVCLSGGFMMEQHDVF